MLVRPFSDLHVEFWQPNKIPRILEMVIPPLPTDKETVALVAGDIGLAHRQETWLKVISLLAKQFMAVIYVEGNHFFYHNDFFGRIQELKAKVSLPRNVHFLENESVEINGVLFVGAILWTDFLGKDFFKMQYARTHMNDFFVIKKADGKHLIPEDTVELFEQSKRFIFETLVAAGDKKRVVVTHHGVSSLSIHDQYRGQP
jgi:predicted phosphohydrolase